MSNLSQGKGSRRRPGDDKAYRENWEKIFAKKELTDTSNSATLTFVNPENPLPVPRHAKLTKTASKDSRPEGLFEGYEVKGYYEVVPTIGKPFIMMRYERNGVPVVGQLTTTAVTKVDGNTFETANSIYHLESL